MTMQKADILRAVSLVLIVGCLLGALAAADPVQAATRAGAATGVVSRASLANDGAEPNLLSAAGSISAHGRFVAFLSYASNLVAGDTNETGDIFLRDRKRGTTEMVSIGDAGTPANGRSDWPRISADGRLVAFTSTASNLVPDDTNGVQDVFVWNRQTGTLRRVSVGAHNAQANGATGSDNLAIAPGGRYVSFTSDATNLVAGDLSNLSDVFVRDLRKHVTERISVANGGAEANNWSAGSAISAGGRFVAFSSQASNLVSGDTNGTYDVFVHDRWKGTTQLVSVGAGGGQSNGPNGSAVSISANGRYVAFSSTASNLVANDTNDTYDVFVRDRWNATTQRVSVGPAGVQGDNWSDGGDLSANGRYIAFQSSAADLVTGDTNGAFDVFVRDLAAQRTYRVSVYSDGTQSSNYSNADQLSADGHHVSFSTLANLVPDDTNRTWDVFVWDQL